MRKTVAGETLTVHQSQPARTWGAQRLVPTRYPTAGPLAARRRPVYGTGP
jgi:hypothetical protein